MIHCICLVLFQLTSLVFPSQFVLRAGCKPFTNCSSAFHARSCRGNLHAEGQGCHYTAEPCHYVCRYMASILRYISLYIVFIIVCCNILSGGICDPNSRAGEQLKKAKVFRWYIHCTLFFHEATRCPKIFITVFYYFHS